MLKSSDRQPVTVLSCVQQQLELDRREDFQFLHERDRKIGKEIIADKSNRFQQLARWVGVLQPELIRQLRVYNAVVNFLFVTVSVLLGAGVGAAVLYYDGSRPVNVVSALLILVALPVVLLILSVLVVIPGYIAQYIPGVSAAAQAAMAVSPARLRRLIGRFAPVEYRGRLERLLQAVSGQLYSAVELRKWSMLTAGQVMAVSYTAGVLLYCLAAIVFTDIAFAWSTTLQIEAAGFHRFTSLLAFPWANIFPDAVPSLELIEATRYFRLDKAAGRPGFSAGDLGPALYGAWWSFLVVSAGVYVFFPRLLLLIVALGVRDLLAKRLVVQLPGADSVFFRLREEVVSTQALDALEADEDVREASGKFAEDKFLPLHLPSAAVVVIWAQQELDQQSFAEALRVRFPGTTCRFFRAGGRAELSCDQKAVTEVRVVQGDAAVLIAVRAWEPPTEELFDFIAELRSETEKTVPIFLLPVASDFLKLSQGEELSHLPMWQRRVDRAGDPWLQVRRWPGGLE